MRASGMAIEMQMAGAAAGGAVRALRGPGRVGAVPVACGTVTRGSWLTPSRPRRLQHDAEEPRPASVGRSDLRAVRHCTRVVVRGRPSGRRAALVTARAFCVHSVLVSVGSAIRCPT